MVVLNFKLFFNYEVTIMASYLVWVTCTSTVVFRSRVDILECRMKLSGARTRAQWRIRITDKKKCILYRIPNENNYNLLLTKCLQPYTFLLSGHRYVFTIRFYSMVHYLLFVCIRKSLLRLIPSFWFLYCLLNLSLHYHLF